MRLAVLSSLAFLVSGLPSSAQEAGTEAVKTAPGKEVRLGYYAVFKKDCTAGPAPQIHISAAQAHGVVRVQNATLATKKVPNCPEIKGPAEVVFYQPTPGYTGTDSVTIDVVNPDSGQSQQHTFTITVGD